MCWITDSRLTQAVINHEQEVGRFRTLVTASLQMRSPSTTQQCASRACFQPCRRYSFPCTIVGGPTPSLQICPTDLPAARFSLQLDLAHQHYKVLLQ